MKNSIGKLVDKTWAKVEKLLRKNGFDTILIDGERALRKFIDETIPRNSVVGLGNSLTTGALKIREILLERGNKIYYAWNGTSYNRSMDTFEELPKPDFFLTTTDSITPEGRLINHEFSNQAIRENRFPENIIAFSDLMNVDKQYMENEGVADVVVFDEKNRSPHFTVAVMPFSKAS